ncbi:MAG: N-acetylneuraminate synthase [Rhodospirillales bacterium]|nr:N-acetylneuraminate synthase [Rhodospirillales bacterium]
MSVFVIAEAGVNHNGEAGKAFALIDAAVAAGADAVKFQTFRAKEVISANAPKAPYQTKTTDPAETQLEMVKKLELSEALHNELAKHCAKKEIRFLSTPFDGPSLRFLVNDMKLNTLKIPSGEITNGPLLLQAGESGCDIILSTGMSDMIEVEVALGVLAFGLAKTGSEPSAQAFKESFASAAGQAALKEKVTVLHCTTEYPAPFEDTNLKAMATLKDAFGLRVGLSDHTPGIAVAIAAAALGAGVIEKHFTLGRSLPGPDHQASLEPGELAEMVTGIRAVEQALGDGNKKLQPSEIKNKDIARKSLVALKPIKAGEAFTIENLGIKRPGTGVSPMEYWERIGKKADHDVTEDEQL